ncbi:3-oxoacyl-ACP synthase [Egibacter rhizosphaerae]|uniref:3-oxoacyl-ACP synthase n=1 Tax=Egibacter rhizosphaerae TaxID=1670831 RepID=A0A411YH89_9ACTN|nr:3-oxoacyl-ACP synthase [Egibacter rhizosphaerae]QBI20705.1 3-oxoacyl-ACP synthase [Egibacter rhizosphaerae]
MGGGRVGIVGTAGYLPQRWMAASELAEASGIPEDVLVERFGLRGKHIAAPDEHVSDLSVAAAQRLLAETGVDAAAIGAVVYFGSTWKDHAVWQAAPRIAEQLGCGVTFALELDYVSCGTPVALRVCRDLLAAEPDLGTVLAVAASRESYLLDYANERARFMFNFGDGAVAGLLASEPAGLPWRGEVLGSATLTDGSFSMDVKVPAGGSVEPPSHESVDAGRHTLDVPDPQDMKERLDPVSLPRFLEVAEQALGRSGADLADIDVLCGIHMKRSIHEAIATKLGVDTERAMYLDDTGHMSGVDPLFGLDRAARRGVVRDGDLVLLLAAGTGYTWAATVVRWGAGPS